MGLEERRQTREIDGIQYEVTPLPFGIGKKALMRLVRILSPILSAAYAGDGAARNAAIFAALPTALSDEDVDYFARVFGEQSKYQNGDNWVPLVPGNQELHFAGDYLRFVRWITFALEVNFAGFFAGMTGGDGALASLLNATPTTPPRPPAPTTQPSTAGLG